MLKELNRTWTMTKRALTTITKLFDHACGLMIVFSNPCVGIKLDALMKKANITEKDLLDAEEQSDTKLEKEVKRVQKPRAAKKQ